MFIKAMETEAEIKSKAQVHCQTWHETYGHHLPASYLEGITEEFCLERAQAYPDNTLIAVQDNEILGFATYSEVSNGVGEIFALYVLKAYQGQQIGYRLIKECLKKLPDARQIILWVLKDNQQAISFYQRCGFVADGQEKEIDLGKLMIAIKMTMEGRG